MSRRNATSDTKELPELQILDIIEVEGKKHKIVGEGVDRDKEWFNARPIDEDGKVIYSPKTLRRICKGCGREMVPA